MNIDFNEIISTLRDEDIFNLLEELGGEPINKESYILCKTICHNEDPSEANQKLYYYKDTHLFYCYTEDGGMNIFTFLKHYYETRNYEYDWYKDIYQLVLRCGTAPDIKNTYYKSKRSLYQTNKLITLPTYSKNVLSSFLNYYPVEWLDENISTAAMKKFDIKYSITQNKIIIPHYDINYNLVGIRGRALEQEEVDMVGKYMPVCIEDKWYSHPLGFNLYGLNLTKSNIKKNKICFLYEGEKSILKMENLKRFPNCSAAACGSNFSKFQLEILLKNCNPTEIVLCFDNEEIKGEDKYFNKLYKTCSKFKNYCRMSFIYDREQLTNYKDSPIDCGEEIFWKLVDERVKV